MSGNAATGDLVVLVADKSMSEAVGGLLRRSQALGVRDIDYRVRVHQLRDAGCRLDSADSDSAFAKLRGALTEWFPLVDP